MLSLAVNGYTAQQVTTALLALSGQRQLTYRFDLLNYNNVVKKALTGVESGSVTYNAANAIKRTATLVLLDDPAIVWASDRIRPYAHILMSNGGYAELPLGTFILSSPMQSRQNNQIVRTINGYDLLQIVSDTRTTDRYAVAVGRPYTSAVTDLLTAAGITQWSLTASPATVATAIEFPIGTSYLAMINKILEAINYEDLWFDALGVAQIAPYFVPSTRSIDWTYANNSQSVIAPGIQRNLDLFAIPNQFVLAVSTPNATPLRSVYVNTNPASPTSTVSRQRTITSVDTTQTAPDQATLDALALRAAYDASQVYETLTLPTLVMPMHAHKDMITVVHSDLGISANYVETGWSFNMTTGAVMNHTLQRVVTV